MKDKMLKFLVIAAIVLYGLAPIDACPGPGDDILIIFAGHFSCTYIGG